MTTSSAPDSSCCGAGGTGSGSWLSRQRLIVAAVAIGGAALWFGWPWLVVAGVAPLLISLAPCLLMCGAMCAFKMCSNKKSDVAATPKIPAGETEPQMPAAAPQSSQSMLQVPSAGTRTSALAGATEPNPG